MTSIILEVVWGELVNDLDALPTVRGSTVSGCLVEIERLGWQLMVQCRIGINYCTTHLRVVDLNHRLQDMTIFLASLLFIFFT
jgi:hypothetical protein